jgi:hypothetical protein
MRISISMGLFPLGGGLISLNLPGTSTHNEFWVTSLIEKFMAVSQVL